MTVQQPATMALDTPGQRIKFLREALGMTQETLAAKVYAKQPSVSQWENDLWIPKRATQVLIAEVLNTKRTFIFGADA